MKRTKLILSTTVLTSLCSGFLGTGTADASEYNNKVVSLRAASDTTPIVSRVPHNPTLYFEVLMEDYNQSDSTQRWVTEYNADVGGYYIWEQTPGSMNLIPQYIWDNGGGFLDFSDNRERVGTLRGLYSAGRNLLGNIFFIGDMSNGNYMSWTRGGCTDRVLRSTASDRSWEQRFIV